MEKFILLAEDDFDVCLTILDALALEGFPTTTVYNGEDALSEYHRTEYDLIILDYQMPEPNGLEVAKHIREVEKYKPDTPIIIYSSMTDLKIRAEAEKIDVTYLVKSPASLPLLIRTVQRLLAV